MHSSAKSQGIPGESRDESLTHSDGGSCAGPAPGVQIQMHTQTQKLHLHISTKMYALTQNNSWINAPQFLRLSSLSLFCQSQWCLAVIHSRGSLCPEWVTHSLVCKAQLIDLLSFRG